jgi:hypothetical protein
LMKSNLAILCFCCLYRRWNPLPSLNLLFYFLL